MSKKFDKYLERATDKEILEADWDAILECVDLIRSGESPAKSSVESIRKKMVDNNPHVALYALLLLDACVKNCGKKVHDQIATKACMEEFRQICVGEKSEPLVNKALSMLNCYAEAFVDNTEYKIVVDTYNLLKLQGFEFPPIEDPSAVFFAQVAPDWVDGDNCFRCRTQFGLLTRKHHCRACGQIFCSACSQKTLMLPRLGIEKNVRVCDSCFEKGPSAGPRPSTNENSAKASEDKKKLEKERAREKELRLAEEEELHLALAISQSEAEVEVPLQTVMERARKMYSLYNVDSGKVDDSSSIAPSEVTMVEYRGTAPSLPEAEAAVAVDDPLAKYLNRDYWQKKNDQNSLAKVENWETSASIGGGSTVDMANRTTSDGDLSLSSSAGNTRDADNSEALMRFCADLTEKVQMMDSRIRSNVARGRPINNDSVIQDLFVQITNSHETVLSEMRRLEYKRSELEVLQDNVAHIANARLAIDCLREEELGRRRQEEEARQRQRHDAMRNKLEMMRAKKQEMLLSQRHAALMRFQQNDLSHQYADAAMPYATNPSYGYVPPHTYDAAAAAAAQHGYVPYQYPQQHGYAACPPPPDASYHDYGRMAPQPTPSAPHPAGGYTAAGVEPAPAAAPAWAHPQPPVSLPHDVNSNAGHFNSADNAMYMMPHDNNTRMPENNGCAAVEEEKTLIDFDRT